MKKFFLLIAALSLLSACAASNANDEAIANLTNELSSAHSSIASLQSDVEDLTLKNESLSADVLQNSNTISELQTEVTYLSNEVTILRNPKQGAPATDASSVKSPKIVIIEDVQAMKESLYSYAYQLYREGKYNESNEKFREFLSKLPNDELSDNAQYWIGENYYSMRDFPKALENFQLVLSNYPRQGKAPDALLKVGYTQHEMGQNSQAKETLNSVIKNYPRSSAATLAKQTLTKWK